MVKILSSGFIDRIMEIVHIVETHDVAEILRNGSIERGFQRLKYLGIEIDQGTCMVKSVAGYIQERHRS